jgi:hypothetical protein
MVFPLQIKTQLTSMSPACVPLHPHLYVLKQFNTFRCFVSILNLLVVSWFQLKSCMVYPLQFRTQLTSVSLACVPLHPHLYFFK